MSSHRTAVTTPGAPNRSAGVAVTAVLAALLVGVPAQPTAATAASRSAPALRLAFDGGTASSPGLASSGSAAVTTTIATANGGTVTREHRRKDNYALRLEPFDEEAPTEAAVVVVAPSGERDPFTPGRRAFAFGAAFKLDPVSHGSAGDNGNNLVQRGLHADDAQYKLQVDDGRVSCEVRGRAGSVVVVSSETVAPDRWHRAVCLRREGGVTLRLVAPTPDGPVRYRWSKTRKLGRLSFSEAPPLSVGGKVDATGAVVESSSDQFNGSVDNVFFRRLDR